MEDLAVENNILSNISEKLASGLNCCESGKAPLFVPWQANKPFPRKPEVDFQKVSWDQFLLLESSLERKELTTVDI